MVELKPGHLMYSWCNFCLFSVLQGMRIYPGSLDCDEIKEHSCITHLRQMDFVMPAEKMEGIFSKKNPKFLWWLEIFNRPSRQGPLDGVWSNLVQWKVPLPMTEELDQMSFKGPNSNHSVVLWPRDTSGWHFWVTLGKSGIYWPNHFL